MPTIFVDGSEGTTGLRIEEYLSARPELERIRIDPLLRKEPAERARCLNAADFAILCLPDAASRESVALVTNPHTRLLDASTAFRTDPEWVYGLPEMASNHRERIASARKVAVPGCHASGFVIALRPLVAQGVVSPDFAATAFSLTGYSGGGKALIATFEAAQDEHLAICPYALGLRHKHLPEMRHHTGLAYEPLFVPAVGRFFQGMIVTIPIEHRLLPDGGSPEAIREALLERYADEPAVRVLDWDADGLLEGGMLSPTGCNNTNRVDVVVAGHEGRTALLVRLDNLGKGAAGAAVQCLNLMLGEPEFKGLDL